MVHFSPPLSAPSPAHVDIPRYERTILIKIHSEGIHRRGERRGPFEGGTGDFVFFDEFLSSRRLLLILSGS